MRKNLLRIAIILFCVWHMTAVAVYIIPDETKDPITPKLEDTILPAARPYLLMTSQWQKWNIFSPDPLRRVSSYDIQVNEEGVWRTTKRLEYKLLPWWNRAKELKILRRVEDGGEKAGKAYLEAACREEIVPRGALVRLQIDSYVIPTKHELEEMGGWKEWIPERRETTLGETYCPTHS